MRVAGAMRTTGAAPANSGTASVAPARGPSLARQALYSERLLEFGAGRIVLGPCGRDARDDDERGG